MEKEKFDKVQAILNAAQKCEIALESMYTIAKQVEKGHREYGKTLTQAVDEGAFNEVDCLDAIMEECADSMNYIGGLKRHIKNKNIPKYDPNTTDFTN